jgi:hypothetical protein
MHGEKLGRLGGCNSPKSEKRPFFFCCVFFSRRLTSPEVELLRDIVISTLKLDRLMTSRHAK